MVQDQRRWTISLIIAVVVLVAAAVLAGNAGLGAARAAQSGTTYTVEAGDSLNAIAAKFGVSPDALAAANDLQPGAFLRRGQVLIIPAADESASTVPAEPTAAPAEETPAAPEPTAEPAAEAPAQPATVPQASTYTVKAGDSLRAIASRLRVSVEALIAANGLRSGDFLRRGQVLIIPSAATGASVAPTEEPTAEPAAEAMAAPTEEATEEATPEPTEEPVAEVTTAPTEEAVEEATPAPTQEAVEEATAAPTEEAIEEATPAPTEEPIAEATPEPTEEPVAEPTAEATPAPTEEAAEEQPATGDVIETAIAAGDLTTLVASLEAAGLTDVLKGDGPFTIFAPTDAAFADLPMGALDALMINPGGDLAQILLYHVMLDLVTAEDITDGMQAMTLQGASLAFSVTDDKIMVNGAQIITANIPATNGVIHVIDTVLVPTTTAAAPPVPAEPAPVLLPMVTADQDAVAAANAWPAPENGPEIYSPVADTAYHSPIAITGLAQPGAGDLAVTLTGTGGLILAERAIAIGESAAFFRTYVRFEVVEPTDAILAVGGHETPVTLLPGQRFVDVNRPATGAVACGAVTLDGYSNTFEANVVLALSTRDGQALEEMPTMGGAYGVYRDFSAAFSFTADETVALLAAAYETDASGRFTAIDQTVIPVTYYPAGSAACQ